MSPKCDVRIPERIHRFHSPFIPPVPIHPAHCRRPLRSVRPDGTIGRILSVEAAVEYINANRLRTMLMRAMDEALKDVDVVITPSYAPRLLQYTNLTGHPAVVLPNGFRAGDGTPTSVSFIGKLFGDAKVLAVAKARQDATEFHTKHPRRFA